MPSVSIPTAVVAAGVGAAGSIGGSLISSSASKSAAGQQAAAANQSASIQQAEFQQNQQNLAPYDQAGQSAANNLSNMIGVNGPAASRAALSQYGLSGLTFQPTQAQLEATPGYQFDLAQGQQGVANSNAAQGLGISGAALKGAANYATGLANNTLTTQQGIFQNNLSNVIGSNQSLANLGENAAAQAGTTGTQGAANVGNTLVGGGNALAGGTVGSANALSSGLSAAGNIPLNYQLYSQLLGGGGGNSGSGYVDNGTF